MSALLEAFARHEQMVPECGGRIVSAGEPGILNLAHLAGHQCIVLKQPALLADSINGVTRILLFVHWFEMFEVLGIRASLAAGAAGKSAPRFCRLRNLTRLGGQHVERTTFTNTIFGLAGRGPRAVSIIAGHLQNCSNCGVGDTDSTHERTVMSSVSAKSTYMSLSVIVSCSAVFACALCC
jgi:hypothetical protein